MVTTGYQPEELVTQSTLLQRGWSRGKIAERLGKPALERPNPHGRTSAPPMKLYELKRVLEYEQTFDDWRKSARRSNASKQASEAKRVELLARIAKVDIRILRRGLAQVRAAAIEHYNARQLRYGAEPACSDSDPRFLARITLNYIRHELVDYDDTLEQLKGMVGRAEAYELLKDRVNDAARAMYPGIT